MKQLNRISRWAVWTLSVLMISGVWFYLWSENPVLGRWTVAGSLAPNTIDFEFYRTRRFESVWCFENGIRIREVGIYKFLPGERVALTVKRVLKWRASGVTNQLPGDMERWVFEPPSEPLVFSFSNDKKLLVPDGTNPWEGQAFMLQKK